jgi:hypothetical protein
MSNYKEQRSWGEFENLLDSNLCKEISYGNWFDTGNISELIKTRKIK